MSDDRLHYLVKSISSVTQDKDVDAIFEKLDSSRDTRDFLDDTSISALKVIVDENGIVDVTTDFRSNKSSNNGVEVLFVRRSTISLTPDECPAIGYLRYKSPAVSKKTALRRGGFLVSFRGVLIGFSWRLRSSLLK